jgi:hypothetical protein
MFCPFDGILVLDTASTESRPLVRVWRTSYQPGGQPIVISVSKTIILFWLFHCLGVHLGRVWHSDRRL